MQCHPLQGRSLWLPVRLAKANVIVLYSVFQTDRAPTRDAPAKEIFVATWKKADILLANVCLCSQQHGV